MTDNKEKSAIEQFCDAVFELVIKVTFWMPIMAILAGWSWRIFIYSAGY